MKDKDRFHLPSMGALIVALLISSPAWGQSSRGEPSTPVEPPVRVEAPPLVEPPPSAEVLALRAQLETIDEYNESFIEVVLWSLGTVATIAFGLGVFGWWTNKTTYERDREALKQERDILRREVDAAISAQIQKLSQEVLKGLDARQGQIATATQQAVEKPFNAKLSKLTEAVKDWADEILELKASLLEREAEDALRQKRYTWALYKYCELIPLSVKRDADYEIAEFLDQIATILDGVSANAFEPKLGADDVNRTVTVLKALPAEHQPAAQKLIQRVVSMQR